VLATIGGALSIITIPNLQSIALAALAFEYAPKNCSKRRPEETDA
jgi:hypothetical protein